MFLTPFATAYRRVNKAHTRHLRCFPMCSAEGHNERGFCGQPVAMSLVPLLEEAAPGARFLAEFCLKDTPKRAHLDISQPSFEGMLEAELSADGKVVTVNSELNSYRYDWMSSRHGGSILHVFRVYVLQPGQPMRVIDSSSFTINSFRGKGSAAPEISSADDALRALFQAMRKRSSAIASSSRITAGDNLDLMDWDALNDMMEVDTFPQDWHENDGGLGDVEVDQLLAVDCFDALLNRIASFVHNNFESFRDLNGLQIGLTRYLDEFEQGVSVEALAAEAQRLFGAEVTAANPCQEISPLPKWLNVESYLTSALSTIEGLLPPDSRLEGEFHEGNDISGRYATSHDAGLLIDGVRSMMGWSDLERALYSKHIDPVVCISVARPSEVSISKLGPDASPGSVGLLTRTRTVRVSQPYWIADDPHLFHSVFGGLTCFFAHSKGMALVKGAEGGHGFRMVVVFSKVAEREKLDCCVSVQAHAAGEDNDEWKTLHTYQSPIVQCSD